MDTRNGVFINCCAEQVISTCCGNKMCERKFMARIGTFSEMNMDTPDGVFQP